jgi:Mg/Co/Ni transporter MgtE
MRPIKFDLPLNGTRIATLEQLEENLTPEILEPFRSGKLAKWLRSRSLDEQAEVVEALLAANVQDEVQLFIKLCEVFEREVDEEIASEMIEDYKMASSQKAIDNETEKLKAELARKELEIAQLETNEEEPTQSSKRVFSPVGVW